MKPDRIPLRYCGYPAEHPGHAWLATGTGASGRAEAWCDGCNADGTAPYDPMRSPKPPPEPPQYILHPSIQAELDARFATLESRLDALSQHVRELWVTTPERPQADAQRGALPAGVVSPHVRRNLDTLAQWTDPARWIATHAPPEEEARMRSLLDHLHGLVMTAMAGEDVPTPEDPRYRQ